MTEAEEGIIYQEPECYRFRSSSDDPHLVGSKCRLCGYIAFPSRIVCPACVVKDSMEEVDLGSKGKILTFSVLHVSAPGFQAPYILAYVVVPQGAKILSLITGCEPSEKSLNVGSEVELVVEEIRKDKQGNEVRGYKFRPITTGRRKDSLQ